MRAAPPTRGGTPAGSAVPRRSAPSLGGGYRRGLALIAHAGWCRDLEKYGFEYVVQGVKRDSWSILRFLYPAELVPIGGLSDQASSLAEWVHGSFRLLASNPPPPPAEST